LVPHWPLPRVLMVQDLAQQQLHDRQHSWHNPILQTYNTPRLKHLPPYGAGSWLTEVEEQLAT
ncbi:MAG TPA: hypothetical protein DCS30_10280, partial [Rhizobiales bacterium]|nr:hypothetical protein [Hyphomicrobiales bacterium]